MPTEIVKRIDFQNKIFKVAIFREESDSSVFDFSDAETAIRFYNDMVEKENKIQPDALVS